MGQALVVGGIAASAQSREEATDSSPVAETSAALSIGADVEVNRRALALGRDLVVDGLLRADAVVLSGDARIEGTVEGDLTVIGGDAVLGPAARVDGDVSVFGGRLDADGSATIGGRVAAAPEASTAWVALLEGPVLGRIDLRVALGVKLALLAFWTGLALLLFRLAGTPLLATSARIRESPIRSFGLGLVGVAAIVLTVLLASALVGVVIGVPLLALAGVVALGLRFWGMVAVFHAVGTQLVEAVAHGGAFSWRPRPLEVVTVGLLALGVLKLVPHLGDWIWMLATFVGVGATLDHALSRRFGA